MIVRNKLHSVGGLSRLIALLLLAAALLLALVLVSAARWYVEESGRTGCIDALASANRVVREQYLLHGYDMTAQEARDTAAAAMGRWEGLCPAGGSVYLAHRDDGREPPYEVVCGLHDSDSAEATRLCAQDAMTQLEESLRKNRLLGSPVTVEINGQTLEPQYVLEDPGVKRGTRMTPDVEGTVIYYTAVGDVISYFCYADELHCARWAVDDGWTGDSYAGY